MRTNQSCFINCQRITCAQLMCFALTGLFIVAITTARGHGAQAVNKIKLSVEDPRPVAEAILKLEDQYGWVITYEDPRYVHESEVIDVARKIRRDLDKFKPGEAVPPVFIPRGGLLEFTYDVAPNTELPTDPARVVQSLLDAQAANSHGGRFRLEKRGKIMHVIPTAIKNSEGRLVPQNSVLDTIISLPPGERTVLQKLESICAVISRTTGIPIKLGTIPDNWFSRSQANRGVMGQKARDVLINMFATMDYGTNLSWRLFYGPGTKNYALNIHLVSKRDG
jgi:hypothetical protein